MTETTSGRQKYTKIYMRSVTAAGAAVCLVSAYTLPYSRLDLRLLLIFALTTVISSRVAVKVPRVNTTITVSDTFIFLTFLLYGVEAAVLIAVADGLSAGLRLSRKPQTVLFNAGAMACATFATATAVSAALGLGVDLKAQPLAVAVAAVCMTAVVQYLTHTWLVAVCLACKTDQPLWPTWGRHYLWSSLTYLVGAFVAGGIIRLEESVGFYSLLVPLPVVSIVYFTYEKYLADIRATAAQAEEAERERAEAEHARAEAERLRAEQAERHVEELNQYIAKLERAGRELEEGREHFRHAAFHDALTGLPNRALFSDHLRLAVERARRHDDYSFAVLFLDLDRFKNINDSLGHSYGDELLVLVARRLETCLRQVDMVARFGGDEFAILLDGLTDSADAVRVAEKLQQVISAPYTIHNHDAFTTASIGIALGAARYTEAEDVLRDADTAMYRAKDGGKARYEMFDAAMHTRAVTLLRMENDLRRAVEGQELRVHYQPIVSVESGELHGFEALVRWDHPERGMIPPSDFIPLAEETGLIVQVGLIVLREACRQTREWQRLSPAYRDLTISVNLSGRQLTQSDLIEQVETVLAETGLDPRCLKLEITESVVMENAELAAVMLGRLRALGVRLAIDDFGTGYSSLSYLHRFPVDTLKIDRSFVAKMGEGGDNQEIVRTIVTLACNLGMHVVAEGIETEDQLAGLKSLGCAYGQGYLFSRPLDAAAAGKFIRGGGEEWERGAVCAEQSIAGDLTGAGLVM